MTDESVQRIIRAGELLLDDLIRLHQAGRIEADDFLTDAMRWRVAVERLDADGAVA